MLLVRRKYVIGDVLHSLLYYTTCAHEQEPMKYKTICISIIQYPDKGNYAKKLIIDSVIFTAYITIHT